MRIRFTLFLLLANVVVFFGIYWLKHTATPETTSALTPFATDITSIDFLEISGRALPQKRVLRRKGQHWQLMRPIEWPANRFAVQRILTQIQFLESQVSFSTNEIKRSGQSLANYGLEDPHLRITLGHDGKKTTIKIGETTKLADRLYLLNTQSNRVFVVQKEFLESIKISLEELRSQEIFDIPLFEIRALTLRLHPAHNARDSSFQRIGLIKEGNHWRFETPIQAKANDALVENTIGQLIGVTSIRFLSSQESNEEVCGLTNPAMQVTLHGNRTQTLLIGSRVPDETNLQYYAKFAKNPTLFTVEAPLFDFLRNAQENLRERSFVPLHPDELNTITIAQKNPHRTLMLQKLEPGTWQVIEKERAEPLLPQPADPVVISRLIEELTDLCAVCFVTDAPSERDLERFGLEQPERTITLSTPTDSSTLLLGNLFHTKEQSLLYAKLKEEIPVYGVPLSLLKQLKSNPLHYRTHILGKQPSAALIPSLTFTDLSTDCVLCTYDTSLSKKEPRKRRKALLTLLEFLQVSEVKDYLKEGFSEKVIIERKNPIPWKYKLEATVILPGAEENTTEVLCFYFTRRLGSTLQIGGSPSTNLIFTLKQPLIDALDALTQKE